MVKLCPDGSCFCVDGGLVLSGDWTRCFCSCGVLFSVCIPDSVLELYDGCFKGCSSLRRVEIGPSSSLERIGASCFRETGVEEVVILDGVCDLCSGCFRGCKSLHHVIFSPSSSLERVGKRCFDGCVGKCVIPVSVRAVVVACRANAHR